MKRLYIIMCLCLLCAFANAQGMLRTIIFADTNDGTIGDGVRCNLEQMLEEVDIIASCLDMENEMASPIVFEQFNCTPENLRKCIKDFRCGKDDIVLFFYFGHGGRSPQDRSDFPQMCFNTEFSQNSQWIPLEDVKNEIAKLNPRFLLVFGDLCNSSDPGITPKYGVLASASAATNISSTQKTAMKKLFKNCKGNIITSGSKKGEVSWYNCKYPDGYGFFTKYFIEELERYTSKDTNPNWETLMKNVQTNVVNCTNDMKSDMDQMTTQTPHAKINVDYINNEPNEKKPEENKTITNQNNMLVDNPQVKNNSELQSMLVDLVNTDNTPMYRIKMRSKVLALFEGPGAWVDMVGRNQRTIVSGETAEEFVERLSTAPYLKNFSIIDCQRNSNGKITFLKIHEIYER